MLDKYDYYRILTVKDLMEIGALSRDKAYALMRTKGFPSFKIGRNYYVLAGKYKEWMESCTGRSITI